jgi:hypothetical protein
VRPDAEALQHPGREIAPNITPGRRELDAYLPGAGADLQDHVIRTDVPNGEHCRGDLPALRRLEASAAVEAQRLVIE